MALVQQLCGCGGLATVVTVMKLPQHALWLARGGDGGGAMLGTDGQRRTTSHIG